MALMIPASSMLSLLRSTGCAATTEVRAADKRSVSMVPVTVANSGMVYKPFSPSSCSARMTRRCPASASIGPSSGSVSCDGSGCSVTSVALASRRFAHASASAARVGSSMTARTGTCTPSAVLSVSASRCARSECPPRARKSASMDGVLSSSSTS